MRAREEIIEILENAGCSDGFACPFNMYGENRDGKWGCFAEYPDGDGTKESQGCIAHQAARLLKGAENNLEDTDNA